MVHTPFALAAAALVAGLLSFGGAEAATVATGAAPLPQMLTTQNTNIQQASHRYRYRYGRNGRYWRGGRYWRPRSGLYLGFGLAPYYYGYGPYYRPYRPYYYRPSYAPAGGSHVRWCLNRYRSYDPRSNTFMGYDGYRHRCRSPYRY